LHCEKGAHVGDCLVWAKHNVPVGACERRACVGWESGIESIAGFVEKLPFKWEADGLDAVVYASVAEDFEALGY
jgi:hypothetical protein